MSGPSALPDNGHRATGSRVTDSRLAIDAPVTIRDRRNLPSFQVRLHAVQAIREHTGGPRRLRAIGFYALLCQLANAQRHTGEHRSIRVTYQALAERGQMSKRSVKLLIDALENAGVLRYERRNERATGAVISFLQLLVHDEPWMAVTVTMADHLATARPGGHLLRDLGLVVVFLEFCAEQRNEQGGLAAEVMRADVATRSGLTVDRVDDCNHLLERTGVLEVTRRRAANGGRHLPSVYTIREAPAGHVQGDIPKPQARRNGSNSPAPRYRQDGGRVLAERQNGTASPEDEYRTGGEAATAVTILPPSNVHAVGVREEERLENNPPALQGLVGEQGVGGGEGSKSPEELCEALLAAWEPVLGRSVRREFVAHRGEWLKAAAHLLGRHSRSRLAGALAYMLGDEILGSQAVTMPGFAKVADQLIVRAHARRLRARPFIKSLPGAPAGSLSREEARLALQRAIQRHGRDGRRRALDELAEQSQLLVRFVERVRWASLCEQPFQYVDRRYAEVWGELVTQANQHAQEPAA
ncbi:MAG: hypothetical protein ACRDPA_35325 [Solirubrobacteraceae bacterium]